MIGQVFLGARCFWRGLALVHKPRIRRYTLAPILLSALVYGAAAVLAGSQFAGLVDWVTAWVPSWLAWLGIVLWVLFGALLLLLIGLTCVVLTSVVAAPFLGPLAGATEQYLTGQALPGAALGATLRRLPHTLLQELGKLLYAGGLSLAFLVLFWIPGVNLVAPLLWWLLGAWLLAFTCVDYPMSNHGHTLGSLRRTLRARLPLAFGFGSVALLASMLPVVNLLALPAGVCGGTILWVECLGGREATR